MLIKCFFTILEALFNLDHFKLEFLKFFQNHDQKKQRKKLNLKDVSFRKKKYNFIKFRTYEHNFFKIDCFSYTLQISDKTYINCCCKFIKIYFVFYLLAKIILKE